jgi:predicted amidophosphoribosyltransferase
MVFPTVCAGCRAGGPVLCDRCRAGLVAAAVVAPPEGVDWWVTPFAYQGAVRRLIVGAKYRQARSGLDWLAGEIAAALAGRAAAADLITWVPAHPEQRRRRGFDQGRLLACGVAARLGLPVRPLLRRIAGAPQTGAARSARTAGGPVLRATAPLTGRSVLVIDDVTTTGVSLSAAAAALRARGAGQIFAATAARTELGICQN